ncbi:hypothetical protein [Nonomuraea sp. NPDC049695]|uniref:hypothetical protein n=1 Tax=Nonomuraea sp. NPDC049695 TaxID=3154734 RepID=UPI003426A5F1
MKRAVAWIAAVLAVLAVVGVGGAGWYYSGLVIDPSHGGSYPLEVLAFDGSKVTLKGGSDTAAPGTYGLTWRDGNATLGPVISASGSTVVRQVTRVRRGTLAPGVRHAKEFRQPILLFVDDDDASVPIEPSLRFARLRPDLVTLVRTRGGGHVGSWNVAQARYEQALRTFVTASAVSS